MKNSYNKKTAPIWDQHSGEQGGPYKKFILDPLMFKIIGSLKTKVVLELGCGNGYLGKRFVKAGAKQVILLDASFQNLKFAKIRNQNQKIKFLLQDATQRWKLASNCIDVVYSNMMLNEAQDIQTPIKEAYRVLKKDGKFVFSTCHPAQDLYFFIKQQAKTKIRKSNRILGIKGYYQRIFGKYVMDHNGHKYAVAHYHRTIEDFFKSLVNTGFTVKQLLEPELNQAIIKFHPSLKSERDYPMALVFYCQKIG